jgi:hypothetical protein
MPEAEALPAKTTQLGKNCPQFANPDSSKLKRAERFFVVS